MNTRTTTGLVTTGWSVIFSLFTVFAAYASTSPNCSDVLAGNTTAVSQKNDGLIGRRHHQIQPHHHGDSSPKQSICNRRTGLGFQ